MPNAAMTRKAQFRAALALAGRTMEEWAESEGVTGGHLSNVLAGKRESGSLTDKVDAFIREIWTSTRILALSKGQVA
jgi:hypothetical protein